MKKAISAAASQLGKLGWRAAWKAGAITRGTENSWSEAARAKRLANGRKRSKGNGPQRLIARLKLERAKIAPFLRDLCPHCGGECRSILEGGIPAQYCEGCKTRFAN